MLTNPKKTFVCQYCGRPFRRLEHVQRHERIHTNETPFKCVCGKCFSRRYAVSVKLSTSILILNSRDLLQRHEKGAHNDEWSRHLRRDDPSGQIQRDGDFGPLSLGSMTAEGGLNPTTAAEQAPASSWQPFQAVDFSTIIDDAGDLLVFYDQLDGIDSFQDMVDFTPWSSRDFAGFESPKQSDLLPTTLAQEFISAVDPAQGPSHPATHGLLEMDNSFSRFGSPLPSLHFASEKPDARDAHGLSSNRPQRPYWKISKVEYHLRQKIEQFSTASPVQFHLPSRHSLSRYLEGCSRGLFEHLPFLHTPTFSTTEAAPELILAMAAIGAQFRFETSQSLVLFYAAKSVLQDQVQRRDNERIAELLCRSRTRSASSTCAAPTTDHPFDTRTSLNSASKVDRENTPILR